MAVSSYARTHEGWVEKINQDHHFASDEFGLYIVSDGVGGHSGGESASRLVVSAASEWLTAAPPQDPAQFRRWLSKSTDAALERINEAAGQDITLKDMAATMTGLYFRGRDFWTVHVGDSRAYIYRDGRLRQITKDHSVAYEQFLAGAISKDDIRRHPNQKLLTRTITAGRHFVVPEITPGQVEPGDRYLVCSDGLCKELSDEEIEAMFKPKPPLKLLGTGLLEAALHAGGGDNVTLIIVEVEGEA